MDCRFLVFTSLLVGLTVAPPPGSTSDPSPPSGSHPGPTPTPGGKRPGPGGPGGSYDFGVSQSENGAPAGSFNNEMKISGQPNQQQEQQLGYGYSTAGQKQGAPNQGNLQGQGFYQGSFKPQDGFNSQQLLGIPASDSQHNQAFVQQNPAFLQHNQAYLQHQMGQKTFSKGSAQNIPLGASWGQSIQGQQDQQLGGFSGSLPGYDYSASASFNGYMPQPTLGAGMGYLPSMCNQMPMVIAAHHDFTPSYTGYGGVPMGMGGYGMPQVYGGQTFPQASQGYAVGPAGTSQGQHQFTQGQTTPTAQGAHFYNPASPLSSQTSNQKLPQVQT